MMPKAGMRVKIIGSGHPLHHHLKIGTVATVTEADAISILAEGECEIGGTIQQWVSNHDFIVYNHAKAVIL